MTTFTAIISQPGCLPDTDEPTPTFGSAQDAWRYLLEERERHEDDTWDGKQPGYSTTAHRLRQHYEESGWEDLAIKGEWGTGSITGPNPDNPNTSLVYEVQVIEEVPEP